MFESRISSILDLERRYAPISSSPPFSTSYSNRSRVSYPESTAKPSLEALIASDGSPKLQDEFEELDLSADPASEKQYSASAPFGAEAHENKKNYYTEKYLGYEPTLPMSRAPPIPPRPDAPDRVAYAKLARKQVELYGKYAQVAQAKARILKLQREKMQAESYIMRAKQLYRKQELVQLNIQYTREARAKEMEYWREQFLERKSNISGRDKEIEYYYRYKLVRIREEKRYLVAARKAEEARLLEQAAYWNQEDAERIRAQVQSFKSYITHTSQIKRSEYADKARESSCFASAEYLNKVENQIKEQNDLLQYLLQQEEYELVNCVRIKERRVIEAGRTLQ